MFKKIVKWSGLALLVLAVAGLTWVTWRIRGAWPDETGSKVAPGLEAEVQVTRDGWGVPHIAARTAHDLLFAQGYVHAQDRLWQMTFTRLAASGLLCSVLGPGPLDSDRFMRTVGLRRAAEAEWQNMGEPDRGLLQAYADGVNAFLNSHRHRLPIEHTVMGIEPSDWTPVDSLVVARLIGMSLSMNFGREVLWLRLSEALGEERAAQLFNPYPADAPVIVPDFDLEASVAELTPTPVPGHLPGLEATPEREGSRPAPRDANPPASPQQAPTQEGSPTGWRERILPGLSSPDEVWGSNAWVVSGRHTASGKPLLANDTHLGLALPSTWYEVHLMGDGIDLYGNSIPGIPWVIMGQNRQIVWGVASLAADVQDLYLEQLDDPAQPSRYRVGEEQVPLDTRVEEIPVKGQAPVRLEVKVTRHGPLLNPVMLELKDQPPVALRWEALQDVGLMTSLRELAHADGWSTFREALRTWPSPALSFVYADVGGNIGYQAVGRLPHRKPGHNPTRPVPGWADSLEWEGVIPFDRMPRAFNPPRGFIAAANHKVVPDAYPTYISDDYAEPFRAIRLNQRLESLTRADGSGAKSPGGLTLDDMATLQRDTASLTAEALLPLLRRLKPEDDQEARALALLEGWDGRFEADAVAPTVFYTWYWQMLTRVMRHGIPAPVQKDVLELAIRNTRALIDWTATPSHPRFDDPATPEVEDRDRLAQLAWTDAIAWLRTRLGDDAAQWRWGAVHRSGLRHTPFGHSGLAPLEMLFNATEYPLGGEALTVQGFTGSLERPFEVVFGVSQRFLADLGDLKRSRSINSSGQVAPIFHRHREDQTALWATGRYRDIVLDPLAIETGTQGLLVLSPETR